MKGALHWIPTESHGCLLYFKRNAILQKRSRRVELNQFNQFCLEGSNWNSQIWMAIRGGMGVIGKR